MKRLRTWVRVSILVALACLFVGSRVETSAFASERPGGGSSFKGSSSSRSSSSSSSRSSSSSSSSRSSSGSSRSSGSSSSSSGSDDFGLIGLLFSSGIGGFGFIGFVIFALILASVVKRQAGQLDWNAGASGPPEPPPRIRPLLEQLRATDPNFSIVLLEDFLYALFAQAHTLRGQGALERLSSHVKPEAREALTALGPARDVRSIIIGAMRYLSVEGVTSGSRVLLEVEFESNYSETPVDRAEQSYYARETWTLSRARGVLSRTPDRARVFVCPSCGAPLDTMSGGICRYCQATVDTGEFDWVVDRIEVSEREVRGPILTGTTEETGTDLPTIVEPDVAARYAELSQRDATFVWPAFQARVAMIFTAMQSSWSNREWAQVRPFVSDNLFQMLAYWIEAYKKERLRNMTEGARVERIELARISTDLFFDALTVRIFATSLDFTVADDDGRIVAGSRQTPRRYSEYWTLIRGVGRTGTARTDGQCPSCGAPLRIEMAGHCEYCRAKVTSGEFDWVLSRIEQDEVYDG